MINYLTKIWKLKDLRNKILMTLFLLLIVRILAHIPLPLVDTANLQKYFSGNQFLGLLNMFSGGTMENFSIILMGVGPYITASIIVQLLQMIIPQFETISKEGEQGQQKLNQYMRLLTVPLAVLQSWSMIRLLESQKVISTLNTENMITLLIITTAGTILLMWLGEIITQKGLGNGISLIIALGIITGLPSQIANTKQVLAANNSPVALVGIITLIVIVVVVAFIILMTEAQRQIPISYARRTRGSKTYGGVESHLPVRLNTAGVIPIIFALSMITFPPLVGQLLSAPSVRSQSLQNAGKFLINLFQNNELFYSLFYFGMVILFTFFYTFIVFKPDKVAENLQKNGGFVPGIRPGRETASHLNFVISRITLTGALFLGFIAIMPFIVRAFYPSLSTIHLGGTSILIIVSVIIETVRQLQSQLIMRTYEKY